MYAGGGFPEVYAAALSANTIFKKELARRIDAGINPRWANTRNWLFYVRFRPEDGPRAKT